MEGRISLREFQAQLSEKLQNASQRQGESSKLGFIAGGQYWLTDLDQVSEVVGVSRLTSVPWARPWFMGVANVRGSLFGCTDFAAFMGVERQTDKGEIRLLLSHGRFGVNAALRIERALGLRSVAEMSSQALAEDEAPWILARWEDREGVSWTEVSMERLVSHPRFLQAGMD